MSLSRTPAATSGKDDLEILKRRIAAEHWFHTIDFGDGVLTPGDGKLPHLQAYADIYFSDDMRGKSFLDIGCWDGFNSVEAHRRGASRVLATDWFVWNELPNVSRRTIELVREYLAPSMEITEIDTGDISVERVGQFDVVLMAGVFYHLRNPFQIVETVAKVVRDTFIIETYMDAADIDRPAMIFYPGTVLNSDPTNWWGPNQACVEEMLKDVGFPVVKFTPHPLIPSRGIFRAKRR